jgi:hypothetical protein
MTRSIVAKKIKIDRSNALYSIVNWENLNQLIKDGWQIVFEDTGEEVPSEQYEELLKPKLYTLSDLMNR